jgi:hypothetical protein
MTTRKGGINRCSDGSVQKKRTVLCGDARTLDYLIAAIKKSQHVPFERRHDCHLTTAFTNEVQKIRGTFTGSNRSILTQYNKSPSLVIVPS